MYVESMRSYNEALSTMPDEYYSWIHKGLILLKTGRFEECIDNLFQSLPFKNDDISWNYFEYFLRSLKKVPNSSQLFKRTIQIYKDSVKLLKDIDDDNRLVRFSYQLGKVLFELGNYTEAIENLKICEQISLELNDISSLALTLYDLARLYHLTGRLEQSRLYFKDSLRLFRRLQDPEKIAAATLALGNLEMQIGKISQALTHLKEAETYYQSQNNSDRLQEINYLLQILQAA